MAICNATIVYIAGLLSDAGVSGPQMRPKLGLRGIRDMGLMIVIVVPSGVESDEIGFEVFCVFLFDFLPLSSLSPGGGMYPI